LSRSRHAFSTKRLGVSRSWTELAMIEGFVFEATSLRPTAAEIVEQNRSSLSPFVSLSPSRSQGVPFPPACTAPSERCGSCTGSFAILGMT
jgi:hypothetical protein